MKNDTGYNGWKYEELDEEEQLDVELVNAVLATALKEHGFSEAVAKNLSVAFKKATLTISQEEGFSGAFHNLADGKPFYRMEIEAKGKSFMDMATDESAMMVFYMMQMLGGGSMTMGGPLVLKHDFRDAILGQAPLMAEMVKVAAPHIRKEMGKAGPKPQ